VNHSTIRAVVLAAGKGTRMKSEKAKVLHEVFYAPMVTHVLDALVPMDIEEIVVVAGHQHEEVEQSLKQYPVTFAYQKEQLGTGHAVLSAEDAFVNKMGVVMVLCGDTPLIRTATLNEMLDSHFSRSSKLTVMTTLLDEPTNYGRIIAGPDGSVQRIVEEKDASLEEKSIKEINAGIYCVDADLLFNTLKKVGKNNKQGEVYLTDIVQLANESGINVNKYLCADADEILGVNSRVELAEAHRCLQMRRNRELMLSGVTLLQPETIWIEKAVSIGKDTVIYSNTYISGKTSIGENCSIGPNVCISNSRIRENVEIAPFSFVRDAVIDANQEVSAYSNIS
jgi:bifunctional UDP-N-acetylglucosamine pyrophosphorylase/glucosamine-1-phosphate N-acetyltransferase